jgi:hypothetical protein
MAGEIQLNSTTMATESSGSITAQLDTIRPNTTNGSLVLQGDSSDAGVTGLTIDSSGNATFAQTISGGTIGSSVVFPAKHVLNVVNNTFTTLTSTTSSTYVDATGYSASITPSSSSNTVLVLVDASLGGSGSSGVHIAVYAGASLVTETKINRVGGVDYCASISYEHSPSTTSSVTYQIKIKASAGTAVLNQNSGMTSYITLMELAG